MEYYDVVIIGGGSAGLSAAVTLRKQGIDKVVILEKDREPGGILEQCIHNGFGLQTFHEQLSGPAYAERYIRMAGQLDIEIRTDTMAVKLNSDKTVEYINGTDGAGIIQAKAVILAVGCYERPRGAININGPRCAGVYTAGQAQRYLNMDGYLVGRTVFILGSGDIGLIMARRMTLEGAKVLGVAELMPYSAGLARNIKQCLEDFNIPLYLSHTVTRTFGTDRLSKIELSEVDGAGRPIKGTELYFDVDALLLSVGLIPENHLAQSCGILIDQATKGPRVDDRYMTSVEGIFACGNGLHVHDLVDFVSLQAERAALGTVSYLRKGRPEGTVRTVKAGENVSYVVPALLNSDLPADGVEFFFRVRKPMDKATVIVRSGDDIITRRIKKKPVPSEMERVTLSVKQIEGIKDDLTIEVREESA